MSIEKARLQAAEWKKVNLEKLQNLRGVVQEFNKNFGKLCTSARALLKEVESGASRLGTLYESNLDDEDANYYDDSDAKDALGAVPESTAQVDDIKTQAGASLEELLDCVTDTIKAVAKVQP